MKQELRLRLAYAVVVLMITLIKLITIIVALVGGATNYRLLCWRLTRLSFGWRTAGMSSCRRTRAAESGPISTRKYFDAGDRRPIFSIFAAEAMSQPSRLT